MKIFGRIFLILDQNGVILYNRSLITIATNVNITSDWETRHVYYKSQ